MGNKKKRSGGFKSGPDPNRNCGAPSVLPHDKGSKKRFNHDLLQHACQNEGVKHITQLPGVVLRPKEDPIPSPDASQQCDHGNDIVDLNLLNSSHADALKLHSEYAHRRRRRPAINHPVNLCFTKQHNVGFGVSVVFHCSGCRFTSPAYRLYQTTSTGGCATNLAAGVALSKVAIKASDACFLLSSLNVNAPSQQTMQKYMTQSCAVAGEMLDDALADNRGVTRDYLHVVGRVDDPSCPGAGVKHDGQFDQPIYHGYDGKSASCSLPVMESETGMNLLVGHAIKSKLDGSYPVEKVVESLELFVFVEFPECLKHCYH